MTWRELRAALGGLWRNPLVRRSWTVARGRTLGVFGFFAGLVLLGAVAPAAVCIALKEPSFKLKEAFQVGYQLSVTAACVGLFLGGISQVTMALHRERSGKTLPGLLLTPLSPPELALGLWLGPALGVLAAAAFAVPVSLVTSMAAGVPPVDWAGVWILVLASAALCHLFGVAFALINPKPEQAGAGVVGVFMALWFIIGPLFAVLGRGNAQGWYVGLLCMTPIPALQALWGGDFRLLGTGGYLLGFLCCMGGIALTAEACCRKLRDATLPAWSRRTLLILAGVSGLFAGAFCDGSAGGPQVDGALILLGWGFLAAFVTVPKRAAFDAWAWRGLPERGPARAFLALGLGIQLVSLALAAFGTGARVGATELLAWTGAALTALFFAELLALCHAFFQTRGAPVALLLFVGVNILPPLGVGMLTRWRHDEFWYVPWGVFTDNLGAGEMGRLVGGLAVGTLALARLARLQEARILSMLSARKAEVLAAP